MLLAALQPEAASPAAEPAPAAPAPAPEPVACPPIQDITLLQATLFDNGAKGIRRRYESEYKLTLEVWTNGAVTPRDAVSLAAKLIRDHFTIFVGLDEAGDQPLDVAEPVNSVNENLDKSVEELELSVRSYNCLKNANIRTIRELVQKTAAEMLKTKNFGRKSLNEIKEILTTMGLGLGMRVDQPAAASQQE